VFVLVFENNHFVEKSKMSIENFLGESDLNAVADFYVRPPTRFTQLASKPMTYSKLVTVTVKGRRQHMRLLVTNVASLLSENSDPQHLPTVVRAEDIPQLVTSGTNVVHCLAKVTVDSYYEALRHARKAGENEREALDRMHSVFQGIVENNPEYRPIVQAVQQFVSSSGTVISEKQAERIVVSYMTSADRALELCHISRAMAWGSTIAGGVVGYAGASCPPLLLLIIPLLGISAAAGYTMAASDKLCLESIEATKAVNFASLLARFKDFMTNRASFVGQNNLCAMLYDDMSDVDTTKRGIFFSSLAEELCKHVNQGICCDFLLLEGAKSHCPCFSDYRNESGQTVFSFYKEIFRRMDVTNSFEEFKTIQDILYGRPSPERLITLEKKKKQ